MNKLLRTTLSVFSALAIGASALISGSPASVAQADRGGVVRFATIPHGAPGHPEGMTADPAGNIYVASFQIPGFIPEAMPPFPPNTRKNPQDPGDAINYIYVHGRNGRLAVSTPLPDGPFGPPSATVPPRAPLGMVVMNNHLYVNDVMYGHVLDYTLPLTPQSVPVVRPVCGGFVQAFLPGFDPNAGVFCALNDMIALTNGILLVSDNGAGNVGVTMGRIFWLNPQTGASGIFYQPSSSPVAPEALNVDGFPVFGVNGLALGPVGFGGEEDEQYLFMANMSTDKIWKLEVQLSGSNPGLQAVSDPTVFAEDSEIDGPDDMAFDDKGRLWISSGQKHQVVAVDSDGDVVDTVGSFDGFNSDGAPRGLCQPSSVVFSQRFMYVTSECNQTLLPEDSGVDWTQLKTFTISRFNP